MNLIRRAFRLGHASGGIITPSPPCDRCSKPTGRPFLRHTPRSAWLCPGCEETVTDMMLAMLSPGRQITDPDEAEALGLTADARRMRGEEGSST